MSLHGIYVNTSTLVNFHYFSFSKFSKAPRVFRFSVDQLTFHAVVVSAK